MVKEWWILWLEKNYILYICICVHVSSYQSVCGCVCICVCVFNLAELRNVVQRLLTWEFQDKQLWTDLVNRKRSGHFSNFFNQNQIFIMKFSGSEPKHCTLLPFLSKILLHIGSWKEGAENSGVVSWLWGSAEPGWPWPHSATLHVTLLMADPPWTSLLGVGVSLEMVLLTCRDTPSPLPLPQLFFLSLSHSIFNQFGADSQFNSVQSLCC